MSLAAALFLAGLTGFISLSYEILWFRAISFVSGSSPAAFGLLLSYYLLGLAVGSFLSKRLCSTSLAPDRATAFRILAGFVLAANIVGFLVLPGLASIATRTIWLAALVPVAAASAVLGAIFPLICHFGIAPDARVGAKLSYVYLANILGAAAGSLLTGFVLLDWFSLRSVAIILLIAGLLLGSVLALRAGNLRGRGLAGFAASAVVALLCIAATPLLFDRFYDRLLYKRSFQPSTRLAAVVENRSGVVAVTGQGAVYGGGDYDGMVSIDMTSDRNGIVRAYASAALHPAPREVLVVGLGTGAWSQVIANLADVERVTIVEINPGYLELIARYPDVASLLTNPKVRFVIDDGRRWLARNPDLAFDLIVANTSIHWRAHTTNLLSVEYLRLIRDHLRPGGVYYFNTTHSDDALKTAFVTFPYGVRFLNFAAVSDSRMGFDLQRLRSALRDTNIDGRPALDVSQPEQAARLDSLASLQATMLGTPRDQVLEWREQALERLGDAEIVTDDNMVTEFRKLVLSPPWPVL